MHPTEVWFGKSAKAQVLRVLLTPLSWLYALGWQGYLNLYNIGLKKAKEAHCPVIVIGNLTTGGSGKTPVTLYVARVLQRMGKQVVISCSGYGAHHSDHCQFAPEGTFDAAEWGDEPAMIRWFLPEVQLVVGRDRVCAERLVHTEYPQAVMLMDDGFQHLPAKKHISIIIEDSEPANEMCIPAGPYREPRANLARADAVIWSDRAGEPGADQFYLVRSPLRLTSADGQACEPSRATALCAIGQPERFLSELSKRVEILDPVVLGDHDPLTSGNLLERLPADLPIIVTAKDWVKLRQRTDLGTRQFVVALQDVRIEPEPEFTAWLAQKLNESYAQQDPR